MRGTRINHVSIVANDLEESAGFYEDLFGAKRLPELGRSLGSGMKEFKDSVTGKDSDSSRTELDPGDAPEPAETVTRADAPVEAEPRS